MKKSDFKKYFTATQYLDSLVNLPQLDYMVAKRGRSLFLKRFEYFLKLIGNPHLGFKYIHVGGTSGKGSVSIMIHSILTAAGLNTGVYTSPYSTTPIEKIKVKNKLISPKEFVQILDQVKPAIDQAYQKSPYGRPSWFEIYTAIALVYFKQKKCKYVVLEVGLGGRYDATNIIPAPKITIINKVGLDHVKQLGSTITDITKEKAAIIKPKAKFFTTSANSKTVLDILKKTCQEKRAEFNLVTPPKKQYQLALLGQNQQHNAEIAVQACQALGISKDKIKAGLKQVKLPCRFEMIAKNPTVILDGAHNQSKINSVVKNLKNLTYKRLYLIIALTHERNGSVVFKNLTPLAHEVIITRYQSSHRTCYSPKELAKKIKSKKPAKIFLDPHNALQYASDKANKNDLILVTGSFYLAGELRKDWRSEVKILTERQI